MHPRRTRTSSKLNNMNTLQDDPTQRCYPKQNYKVSWLCLIVTTIFRNYLRLVYVRSACGLPSVAHVRVKTQQYKCSKIKQSKQPNLLVTQIAKKTSVSKNATTTRVKNHEKYYLAFSLRLCAMQPHPQVRKCLSNCILPVLDTLGARPPLRPCGMLVAGELCRHKMGKCGDQVNCKAMREASDEQKILLDFTLVLTEASLEPVSSDQA